MRLFYGKLADREQSLQILLENCFVGLETFMEMVFPIMLGCKNNKLPAIVSFFAFNQTGIENKFYLIYCEVIFSPQYMPSVCRLFAE